MRQYVREQAEQLLKELLNPLEYMPGFPEGTPTAVTTLDEERTLGFTLGAMRRIKERLGSLEMEQSDDGAILALPVYVWACMDADGRKALSVEAIEDMIHPRNMKAISDAVAALFEASQPEGAEGNADPPTVTEAVSP